MSELRRSAKALVEQRTETFESRHALDMSKARLAAELQRAGITADERFAPTWRSEGARAILDARFSPSPRTQGFLRMLSLAMTAMVVVSAWAIFSPGEDRVLRYLAPLLTALSILALPFVALGLASQREADESRIRKAIRLALIE